MGWLWALCGSLTNSHRKTPTAKTCKHFCISGVGRATSSGVIYFILECSSSLIFLVLSVSVSLSIPSVLLAAMGLLTTVQLWFALIKGVLTPLDFGWLQAKVGGQVKTSCRSLIHILFWISSAVVSNYFSCPNYGWLLKGTRISGIPESTFNARCSVEKVWTRRKGRWLNITVTACLCTWSMLFWTPWTLCQFIGSSFLENAPISPMTPTPSPIPPGWGWGAPFFEDDRAQNTIMIWALGPFAVCQIINFPPLLQQGCCVRYKQVLRCSCQVCIHSGNDKSGHMSH